MSYEEESIARTQMKGGKSVSKLQSRGIGNLDDRIVTYLAGIAFVLLCVVWAVVSSPLILYGSLVFVILQTVMWGIARIRQIEQLRLIRAQQAESARIEQARR